MGESRYTDTARSKRSNFETINFGKQRHVSNAECPQESNSVICFSLRGLELTEITFYCMMSPFVLYTHNVVEINLAFGGQKLTYRFEFGTVVGTG